MFAILQFRDTVNTLHRLNLKVAMPSFLHNQKQFSADDANRARCVTKNRWVIESGKIYTKQFIVEQQSINAIIFRYFDNLVNGKIKQWKFMAQTMQNSTLRFISDYLDIICSLINKYQCPAINDIENGREIAIKMREMLTTENRLRQRLEQHTAATSLHWSQHNASNFRFPPLTEQNIRDLTFGNNKKSLLVF